MGWLGQRRWAGMVVEWDIVDVYIADQPLLFSPMWEIRLLLLIARLANVIYRVIAPIACSTH